MSAVIKIGYGPGIDSVAPSGGGGGGVTPTIFETTDAGQAGISALTAMAPSDGQMGIIDAAGTPVMLEYDATRVRWFRVFASGGTIGQPYTITDIEGYRLETPGDAGWTETTAAGQLIDYDTTVPGAVAYQTDGVSSTAWVTAKEDPIPAQDDVQFIVIDDANLGYVTTPATGDWNAIYQMTVNVPSAKALRIWAEGTTWRVGPSYAAGNDTGINISDGATIELYLVGGRLYVFEDFSAAPSVDISYTMNTSQATTGETTFASIWLQDQDEERTLSHTAVWFGQMEQS